MPIYEYQCDGCGHKLEVMQRMSDARLTTCPDCNQDSLKKLISAVGFQLKGTGWYETDFKNSGKPPEKKADKADKGGSDKSATKSTTASSDTKSSESSSAKAGSTSTAD